MKALEKLFGEIELTWKKLIIWAVAMGLLVGGLMLVPAFKETSLQDIGVGFEWWILFGVIIVSNAKSPVDSALKSFVFFLISQPLIYLVQVPFSSLGWGIMNYYQNWILWTLATIPMGAIGYFVQRGDLISSIILSGMTVFLGLQGVTYAKNSMNDFPHHIVSAILCVVFMVIMILGIIKEKKAKILAWVVAAGFLAVYGASGFMTSNVAGTVSFGSSSDLKLDKTSEVVTSTNIDDVRIDEITGEYMLIGSVSADNEAEVTISTGGKETTYRIYFNEDHKSFEIAKK